MTNTNLATINANNVDEINKAFGFDNARNKPSIPLLKINGTSDDDGTTAPKGTFTYSDGEKTFYTKEITIRAYLKAYQYRLYHPTDKAKNDMSIIANNFKAEFRSMSGKIACGKMPKKAYLELGNKVTPTQKYYQDSVKCKLMIFGVVSGNFIELTSGEKVELKDELFVWTTSQVAFMPMDGAISGIEKERRAVPLTPISIKLNKEKNGAVTYYVPVPTVEAASASFNAEKDGAYLETIKSYVKDTNSFIENRYNSALTNKAQNNDFANLGEIIDAKDDFINDPLSI